jgi:uncharacterized protein (DUF1697 family)
MTRYALFLRGVNVGTKNSLPMAELRAMLEAVGCKGVETYVQSGNAVLETDLAAGDLSREIEARLEAYMGRPIATALRTRGQMRAIVKQNPFQDLAARNPATMCVTFLSHAPTRAELAPLRAVDFGWEKFHVAGREIYTWHEEGQGRSKLAAAVAKLPLRGTQTTRNWNTVRKLLEMVAAHG